MAKTKLKPCPFCGGEEIEVVDGYADDGCWVTCLSCAAQTGAKPRSHKEAIQAWNTRKAKNGKDKT